MKLFLSYSRDDKAWTYELHRALNSNKTHSAWIDREITPSTDWWDTILTAIEECDCFLYILSPLSVQSIYCQTEMKYALALNKPILPVMLKFCKLPKELDQKQIQYLDVSSQTDIAVTVLPEIVKNLVIVEESLNQNKYPSQEAERPAVPTSASHTIYLIKRLSVPLMIIVLFFASIWGVGSVLQTILKPRPTIDPDRIVRVDLPAINSPPSMWQLRSTWNLPFNLITHSSYFIEIEYGFYPHEDVNYSNSSRYNDDNQISASVNFSLLKDEETVNRFDEVLVSSIDGGQFYLPNTHQIFASVLPPGDYQLEISVTNPRGWTLFFTDIYLLKSNQ